MTIKQRISNIEYNLKYCNPEITIIVIAGIIILLYEWFIITYFITYKFILLISFIPLSIFIFIGYKLARYLSHTESFRIMEKNFFETTEQNLRKEIDRLSEILTRPKPPPEKIKNSYFIFELWLGKSERPEAWDYSIFKCNYGSSPNQQYLHDTSKEFIKNLRVNEKIQFPS